VKIDNYPIEVIPEGNMLVIYNKDLPGTVGKLGTLLGKEHINIARLFLGRDKAKGTAITIINLDTEVSETVIKKLRKVPNALFVQRVTI
jgi:D-3-phosphoglycerate dehydrogenase